MNTVNDSGAGSLRDAITQANSDGGANISFNIPNDSAQNPQTIGVLSALPALGDGITISGPGANALTVSGRNSFQVFTLLPARRFQSPVFPLRTATTTRRRSTAALRSWPAAVF